MTTKSQILLLATLTMLATLSACRGDFDYEPHYTTSAEQKFDATFINTFRSLDANHTWNTVVRDTIQVRVTAAASSVLAQVYTSDPRGLRDDCFLMAEQRIPTASSVQLTFDAPSGLDYVYLALTDNDGARLVRPVALSDARNIRVALSPTYSGNVTGVSLLSPSSSLAYPFYNRAYRHTHALYQVYQRNLRMENGMTTTFEYLSAGTDIYIIPMGTTLDSTRTLGFVCYNPADLDPAGARAALEAGVLTGTPIVRSDAGGINVINNDNNYYTSVKPYVIRNVPVGFRIMFYIELESGERLYSVSTVNDYNLTVASTMDLNGHQVMRFDTGNLRPSASNAATSAIDDFAFVISGGYIVDHEVDTPFPMGYTLALDIPGDSINDMDFNDGLVCITHVCGSGSLGVVPLAVGDTLAVAFHYGGQVLSADLHAAFGVDRWTLVNTSADNMILQFDTIKMTVPEDFSIVDEASHFAFVTSADDPEVTSRYTLPEQAGAVPRVILMATPRWNWPSEGTSIDIAYPYFRRWVSAMSNAPMWYTSAWDTINETAAASATFNDDNQL